MEAASPEQVGDLSANQTPAAAAAAGSRWPAPLSSRRVAGRRDDPEETSYSTPSN